MNTKKKVDESSNISQIKESETQKSLGYPEQYFKEYNFFSSSNKDNITNNVNINEIKNNAFDNKSNLFNINNEKNYYFSFLPNDDKNINLYNRINQNNININTNINYPNMSNYYKDYNFYLYKQYEIFQRENNSYSNNNINNINTNPNSYNLYIGNNLDIINNNSFYFAQVGILNKIHFLQNQNINLKNINDININNFKIDFANINISNINQNCNYYNFLEQSKVKNNNKSEFNSILNINKMNNNENENNINGNNLNNYLNYSNGIIINSDNKNNIYDFMQYINSLPIDLVNFLCTPKGVSQVQKKLEESNNIYNLFLVNFLNKQGLSKIMKDTYGNYFFQKLIKKKDKSFISLIVSYISEDFIDISKDYSGTFSLQALLDETSSVEEQQKIFIKLYKK